MTDQQNTPEQKIADDVQPVIEATEALAGPERTASARAFFKKYLKGWIVLAGTIATLVLAYVPAESVAAQIAAGVVATVTVVGVIAARNGA